MALATFHKNNIMV